MQAARCLTGSRRSLAVILGDISRFLVLQPQRKNFNALPSGSRKTGSEMMFRNTIMRQQSTSNDILLDAGAHQDNMLVVRWKDGKELVYPNIWLRDNCQCPSCFHQTALSRRVMLKSLSLSVSSDDVKISNDGEELLVKWSDGHKGVYGANWLKERSFTNSHHGCSWPSRSLYMLPKIYWGRDLQENVPLTFFPDLLQSDRALLAFLKTLEVMGVVLVTGVPVLFKQLHLLTKRVGHLKVTHYGESFLVQNESDSVNLAYTGDSLDLHTDLPYLEQAPGIQLLHCIKQFCGEGGNNVLADGFAAAMKLHDSHPEHFKVLTETLVDFHDEGLVDCKKFYAHSRRPVIELNTDGTIKNIFFNQMVRDSHFEVSPDIATSWYAAYLTFRDLLYEFNNHITVKMEPGDMLVFDNQRVLHGRHGYAIEKGERILEGGYWEWDNVRSLRMILQRELTA